MGLVVEFGFNSMAGLVVEFGFQLIAGFLSWAVCGLNCYKPKFVDRILLVIGSGTCDSMEIGRAHV